MMRKNHVGGCLVCGEELVYGQTSEKMECFYCGSLYDSNAKCRNGHFVCDGCHSSSAHDLIERFCVNAKQEDPLEMACTLMRNRALKMHGPEHHFLVPAVLLAAYYNTLKKYEEKEEKIKEARKRSENILGGFCGYYGDCGAEGGQVSL